MARKFQVTFTTQDDEEESVEDIINLTETVLFDHGFGDIDCREVPHGD